MIIGVPKEIKNNENRIALTPGGVSAFKQSGHEVVVERGAGAGSGYRDDDFAAAGARIAARASEVWQASDLILKVKEPIPEEFAYFRKDLILFTYLHLAANPELVQALTQAEVIGVAYETVSQGRTLPLLTPMSEIAGRMSVQIGAHLLEKMHGGKGILLGGVPGVRRGKVTIVGGGVVGTNAAKIAAGMGAQVTILDKDADRLRQLDDLFGASVTTLMSNPSHLAEAVAEADLCIGAVLIPGAKAPKLVSEDMIRSMQAGSVVVDVAVDQGGVFATIERVTTHDSPTFEKHGVIHYAVANMPGAVPRTSTMALTNVTVPYALQIADQGIAKAVERNAALKLGVNTAAGYVTYEAVARDLDREYVPVEMAMRGGKLV
ncbi:alanine dehydrogenase [Cohnella rhizosphaerae]|uniref:Alanine dehydrogenase n=1 Tax=Cohnella rhizosphaerae TaxID=1457232 RepID=A0A9X4KXI2_9BACL|nr:alanine dehydrogenase [Cohnella rhizosphaerae]MDG0812675.1 alanine dehydrogenase [Cohnella rhizosphaerae]